MRRIYLDHSATTPVDPRVVDAMLPFLHTEFGNPSSAHAFGRTARVAIEQAREQIARLLNAQPSEIVFTASGSESNNMALFGLATNASASKRHLVSNRLEHHAVLHPLERLADRGYRLSWAGNDASGKVQLGDLESSLSPETLVVSIMHVNNEIGTINPVVAIGELCRDRGVLLHVDAVQSFGKIPMDVRRMHIDLLSASAHKIYGPKGIGILYVRHGIQLDPLVVGGNQERGHRAGTENTAGIVGFGKAAEIAFQEMEDDRRKLTGLHEKLLSDLKCLYPMLVLNGHPVDRLPGHLSLSLKGIRGDELMMMLDLKGVAVSTGSACTSGSVIASHVLEGLQLDEETSRGTIRISLGRSSNAEHVATVVSAIKECVDKMISTRADSIWPR